MNRQCILSLIITLLLMIGLTAYSDITPVSDRTPEVRDAIVDAISGVDAAVDVTETHLAAITSLNLRNAGIPELKTGDLSGLSGLTSLNLYGNELNTLPDGIFEGLTALTTLRLGGNTVDRMPISVSLERVSDGQLKAVAPTGAPFAIVVPISATNGSIADNASSLSIAKGSTESSPVIITRSENTTVAVIANIGTLPSLPTNHYGYVLSKSSALPLEVASALETPLITEVLPPTETEDTPSENVTPVFTDGSITIRSIAENTESDTNIGRPISATDTQTLTYTLGGIDRTSFSINSDTGQLLTKASLDYETKRVYIVVVTSSDGVLTDTITVVISVIDISETTFVSTAALAVSDRTPAVRDAIVDAVSGVDSADDITAMHLASITSLNLRGAGITSLKTGDFSGLTALSSLNLYGNMLSRLPHGIFDGLTSLLSLRLGDNLFDPMPLTVSLQQVGTGQFRAVILTGAPFDVTLTIGNMMVTISKGSLTSENFTATGIPTISALPVLPATHFGYIIANSDVCSRTLQVSDAIVAALSDITDCRNVSDVHLAQITRLDLSGVFITSLAADDFAGLLSLTTLDLSDNQLINLPKRFFDGFLSLTALNLSGNTFDPLSINVMLEKVGTNQVKVVVPSGAPFEMTLPINVVNGGILGGTNTITLMQGSMESQPLTIIRAPNTFDFVTADISTMPNLPTNHAGYVFTNSNDTPLQIFEQINVAPVFTDDTTATRSIAENTEAGTDIGTPISATDVNNDTLTYSLGGSDVTCFDIDSTTGQLKTKEALDYETKTSYSVVITVSDGSLTDTIDVTINITDVDEAPPKEDEVVVIPNDDEVVVLPDDYDEVVVEDTPPQNNAPMFTDGNSTTRSIAENTTSGANIGNSVSATDADRDTLTYTLDGTDASAFTINRTNGQLQTSAALDFEAKNSYSVTITVSDGKDGTDSISVTINITNVNEDIPNNDPVFTDGSNAIRSIAENTGSGVDIDTPVSATDADDGNTLSYSLGGTDAAAFSIDSTSGQLRTSAALDYETKNTYSITISVSDGNGGSDTISVTINITNVDETPTNSAPEFAEGVSTSRSVAENTGSGVDIGSAVSATDVDGDTLTYTLGGTDASSFSLDSSSGQLRTSASLDYETKTSYSVVLTVSDENGGSDSLRVTINITNIDEAPANNSPVFTSDSTTRTIAENTVVDTNIGAAITATDADDDTLTYGLTGTDAASFSIVSRTGQLKTKAVLNHEVKDSYSLIVTVSDGQGGSDSISITINVLDVNESPSFSGESTTRSIAENTTLNTNIGAAVIATDPDDGTTLTYTLGGTDAAVFSIDSKTGQLKTKGDLDFETKKTYSVTIAVSDGNLSDMITVTINVTDLDETPSNNPPVFTDGETTTRSVAENTATGTDIGNPIAVTDADQNTLAYAMSGDDASTFSINLNTGQLKTSAVLNYEVKKVYEVSVTVNDGSGTDSIVVTINVTDVNEAPVFEDDSVTHTIAENTAANTNIGSAITITDPDGDNLTYTLGGTDAASFNIGSTNGQLRTKDALDYETKRTYSVTVTASDGKLSDSITVTINVTDVDENNAPAFASASTTRSVAENTGSGVNIGNAVSASDPDNDDLTYTLGGTDAASFNIGSTNGQLRTKDALDYETKRTYSVTVTASDGKLSDSITVTINVTDVDENNAPAFASASTTRSVAENTGSGVNIGSVITATDPDNDDLTYTLGGTDAASFNIGSINGQLRTKDALDYETKRTYSVTVTASDGKLSDSITVTINVNDVDENRSPAFASASTTRSVAENTGSGVNIGNAVSATDPDNDDLTYTLGGTDAASFNIGSTNGQLRTKDALDYETKRTYSVTVTASDGKLSDSITVTINVTDVDENNAPAFASASTTRSVAENTATNTDIGHVVSATDEDDDTLTYTLGGTNASSFNIVSSSGQLKTKAALNYENKNSYSVTVSVSDGGGGTDSINVSINISDVNDPPKFTDGNSTSRSVEEEVEPDTNIGTPIAATDEDGDTLTYYMTGDDADAFSIDEEIGQLKTKESLDYETKKSYAFSVWVTDADNTEVIIVTVKVTDVDENRAPVFTDGESITRSIIENSPPDTNIGNPISATDINGDTLTYTLNGTDSESFTIDSATGQLKTKKILDFERQSSYTFTITVSDGNGKTDSIRVTINITNDTTDNSYPTFTDGDSTLRSVQENLSVGTNIGAAVTATDVDSQDTLIYSISGTNAAFFTIDSSTGQIKTARRFDYETQASYSVTVHVNDGVGGSDRISVTINVTDEDPEAERSTTFNTPPDFGIEDFRGRSFRGRSIDENKSAGTNIGIPVTATDEESDTLTYTLSGADAGTFTIVSSTGQIKTTIIHNFEVRSEYRVDVNVSDGNGGTDSIEVRINVNDLIENPLLLNRKSEVIDSFLYALNKAEATITSADIAGIAEINLHRSGITTLSASDLSGLNSITELSLSGNNISSLPADVFNNVTTLTNLFMDGSQITSLPSGIFDKLTALEYLYLSSNKLTSLPSGIFDKLTALRRLEISNTFSSLPTGVFDKLTSLRYLQMSAVSNSLFTATIFDKLTSLYRLSMIGGDITTLPSGIFDKLTSMVELEIILTDLSSLPEDIFDKLTSLRRLQLYRNNLTSLPAGIFGNLTALEILELDNNELSSIPDNLFKGLTRLELVDLRNNTDNPLPILVILEKVADGQFKVKVPTGAPMSFSVGFSTTNGSISGGTTSVTIDVGSVESSTFTVTRTDGTTGAVTVDISSLPSKPYNDFNDGFTIVKEDSLPLTVIGAISSAPSQQIPNETSLLANYPNPFNPDTWIPYRLAKPADVSLTIYDVSGVVVRTLRLGHKPAGIYTSRSRAIHWDGRNAGGEKVAGGVYFYQFKAGEYSALRKMLIVK